jgi:DNA-binding transcriptional regulator GbsR (MarR family)
LRRAADEEGAGEKLAIFAVSHRDGERRQTDKNDCGHEMGIAGMLFFLGLRRQPFFPYIRNMSNMSTKPPGEREQRFVEDLARLLLPWGVPTVAARLYGYLLLCPRPVSLDRITADVGISKSSASVAARLLESYTLARRHRERGTKRALYAVADDYETTIRQQNHLLEALAEQLDAGVRIATSKQASARLREMADFYRVMHSAMEDAVGRWKRSRP